MRLVKRLLFIITLLLPAFLLNAQCFDAGNGHDGIFESLHDTTIPSGEYHFTTFTIAQGVTVNVTGNQPLFIHVKGTVSIQGLLTAAGESGTNGSANAAGRGGIATSGGYNGGNGGRSLNGALPGASGYGAGAGNAVFYPEAGTGAGHALQGTDGNGNPSGTIYGSVKILQNESGSGGSGGTGIQNEGGGGGGAGGGLIIIHASGQINISTAGILSVNGGNGGNGYQSATGGGGGSGGCIWLASTKINCDGKLLAYGGTGGSGSLNGGHGSEGRIRLDFFENTSSGIIAPSPGYTETPFLGHISRSLNVKCPGTATGYAKARGRGGVPPYHYQWSDGSFNAENTTLYPGAYSVIITDQNGCSVTDQVTIADKPAFALNSIAGSPSCYNYNDGYVLSNATGGNPFPLIKTVSTTFQPDKKSYGLFFSIEAATAMQIDNFLLSVAGNDSTSITIWYRNGDYAGYENDSNAWMKINAAKVLLNGKDLYSTVMLPLPLSINAGTHSFCIASAEGLLNIVNPSTLASNKIFDHSVSIIKGISKGDAQSAFTSGNPCAAFICGGIGYRINNPDREPYIFSSSSGITTGSAAMVPAGNCNITVTDALGCTMNKTVSVPAAQPITADVATQVSPQCHGAATGSLEIKVDNGNYSRSLLSAGKSVAAIYGQMFSMNLQREIELTGFSIALKQNDTVSVYFKSGDYTGDEYNPQAWTFAGSYTMTANGTGLPQSLILNNATVLGEGIWSVYLYSRHGSLYAAQFASSGNVNNLQLQINSGITNGSASGGFSSTLSRRDFYGSVEYKLAAGGYNLTWPDGSTGTVMNNISGGNYNLTVSDTNGCIQSFTVNLPQPDPVNLLSSITAAVEDDHNGSALVSASGGTPPYFYYWLPGGITGPEITNAAPGNYTLLVSDAHGCTVYDTLQINRISDPGTGLLTLQPNPSSTFIKIGRKITGMENCMMKIFDVTGRLIADSETSVSILMNAGVDLSELSDGQYTIQLSDDDQVLSGKMLVIR